MAEKNKRGQANSVPMSKYEGTEAFFEGRHIFDARADLTSKLSLCISGRLAIGVGLSLNDIFTSHFDFEANQTQSHLDCGAHFIGDEHEIPKHLVFFRHHVRSCSERSDFLTRSNS